MYGRWGGRESPHRSGPTIAFDWWHPQNANSEAEDISLESVQRLYERPGTAGEKEAARQAIIRMTGRDPESSQRQSPQQEPRRQTGPKHYHVELTSPDGERFETTLGASDQLDAEAKARAEWKRNGGKVPFGTRAQTRRV